MMRMSVLALAALTIAGCSKGDSPATLNETVPNVTAVDANAMPDDANITDVPEDDGDAAPPQGDTVTTNTTRVTKMTKTERQ